MTEQKFLSQAILVVLGGSVGAAVANFALPKIWPDNTKPNAVMIASETRGIQGSELLFSGSKSSDPEGGQLNFQWFVDSNPVGSGQSSLKYVFASPGDYEVSLKVSDIAGLTHSDSEIINVSAKADASNPESMQVTWTKRDGSGFLLSQVFSHTSEDRHNKGAKNTGGTYEIDDPSGRIYEVSFRHEGEGGPWNYNPDGGYSGKTAILNDTTFSWERRWDGPPCTEYYEAFYEIPQ